MLYLVNHRNDEDSKVNGYEKSDYAKEDNSLGDYAVFLLVQPYLQPFDGLLRRLSPAFEDIGKADVTYEDEIVHIIEKTFDGIEPILLIEEAEKYIRLMLIDLQSRERMRKPCIEISQ